MNKSVAVFRLVAVSGVSLLLPEARNPVPFPRLMRLGGGVHDEVDMGFRRRPCRRRITGRNRVMDGDMLPQHLVMRARDGEDEVTVVEDVVAQSR